jgi:hypothetical protein
MAILKKSQWIRLAVALTLALGFSGALSAYEATFQDCVLNCGGGCRIVADNCEWCEVSTPQECTIWFIDCEDVWCTEACGECIIID